MTSTRGFLWLSWCLTVSCASSRQASSPTVPDALPAPLTASAPSRTNIATGPGCPQKLEALPLPGARGPVSLDYLFYEPARSRVWIPAGGTGSVAVFDIAAQSFTLVTGFATAEREARGKKRMLGPSSGAVGDGYAYVGDRASNEVCAVDLLTLRKGACSTLAAPPDGVVYVAPTHEVWVTAPSIKTLFVFAASAGGALEQTGSIVLPGEPEGYAVDTLHGRFLTNLEDANRTLSLDLATKQVKDAWSATCNEDGPRGIAVDSARQVAFVACTDHVQTLDLAHGGAALGRLECGPGLDNIEYDPSTHLLYAASGKASRLTVARAEADGKLTSTANCETVAGGRNAVVDMKGNVYIADAQGARLLQIQAR
jgi:DNA-binding beta-propeller fold protein YncE